MSTIEFSREFKNILKPLHAFALKLTRDEEAAKDLIQETAGRAFRHRDKFRPGTNFPAWMNTILRNTFINMYRKSKSRIQETSLSIQDNLYWLENRTAEGDAASPTNYSDLLELVEQLDETYRVPFLMFYRGYRYDEIAEFMDLPMGTVKSRIFYARKQLKNMVREHYPSLAVE